MASTTEHILELHRLALQSSILVPFAEEHKYEQREDRSVICSQCGKEFQGHNAVHYHRHMRQHAGELPAQCSTCGQRFRDQFNVQMHERAQHTREQSFACPHCDKRFSHPSDHKRHLSVHLPAAERKSYECTECKRTFRLKNQLNRHLETHRPTTESTAWTCDRCSKSFASATRWGRHMRESHGIRRASSKGQITTSKPCVVPDKAWTDSHAQA